MLNLVSVILPTFNRERFLPDAFDSIQRQNWRHWELIVVDDGSTDGTRAMVEQRSASGLPIRYVFQENRGAYAARNTGLDHATGDYIAFFDSDDLWLPDYLERCVAALDQHPDLDWVYAACRSVDESTGNTLSPSTFHVDGAPRPFLAVPSTTTGQLHVLESGAALMAQLRSGLYAGLQNSVIRRKVFQTDRFWDDYRVVEDVLFLVRSLVRGIRVGYIDEVLVIYRVHSDNSSASVQGATAERLLPIFEEEVRGLERLRAEVLLPADARALLERQLGTKYFWRLGYAGYWQLGQREQAFRAFRTGMRLGAFDWRMWKTYGVCWLKILWSDTHVSSSPTTN